MPIDLIPRVTDEEDEQLDPYVPAEPAPFLDPADAYYTENRQRELEAARRIENDANTYVAGYMATPEFVEDTRNTRLQALRNIVNDRPELFVDNADNLDKIAAQADEFKRMSGRAASQEELKHYFPPFPDTTGMDDDEKLEALSAWDKQADSYGAELARQTGNYADYLIDRNDFLDYKNALVKQTRRNIKGDKKGYVGDKVERFLEGGATFFTSVAGADDATEFLNDYFTENPKYDTDKVALIAAGLGQGLGQMLAATGAAAATVATGGTAAAATAVAGTTMFGANASLTFQDAYNQAYEATKSHDKGLEAGFYSLGTVPIETLADMIAGAGFVKGATKSLLKTSAKEGLKRASKKEMVGMIMEGTRNVTNAIIKSGAAGAIAEPLQGAGVRSAVNIAVGDDVTEPFDMRVIAEEALIGGAVEGIIGGIGASVETGVDAYQAGVTPEAAAEFTRSLIRSPIENARIKAQEQLPQDGAEAITAPKQPNPLRRVYDVIQSKDIVRRAREEAGTLSPREQLVVETETTLQEQELSPEELARVEEENITQTIEGAREEITRLDNAVKAQTAIKDVDVGVTQEVMDSRLDDLSEKTGLSKEEVKAQLGVVEQDVEEGVELEEVNLETIDPRNLRGAVDTAQAESILGRQSKVIETITKSEYLPGDVVDHMKQHGGLTKHVSAKPFAELTQQAQTIVGKHGADNLVESMVSRAGAAHDDLQNLYPNEQLALADTIIHDHLLPQLTEANAEGKVEDIQKFKDQIFNVTKNYLKDPLSEAGATLGTGGFFYSKRGSDAYRAQFISTLEDQIKYNKATESPATQKMRKQLTDIQEELAATQANIAANTQSIAYDKGLKDVLSEEITQLNKDKETLQGQIKSLEAEIRNIKQATERKAIKKTDRVKAAEKEFNRAKKDLENTAIPPDYITREKKAGQLRDSIGSDMTKKVRLQERLRQEHAILSPEERREFNKKIDELDSKIEEQQDELLYTFKDPVKETKRSVKAYVKSLSSRRNNITRMIKERGC